MRRLVLLLLASGPLWLAASHGHSQSYPILDRLAGRVIQRYQDSSCQQIAAQRTQHPTGRREQMEQQFIQTLHQDPQMRQAFINRVAAPIGNKLFECGVIP